MLYLPDEILVVDSDSGAGVIHRFDFVCRDAGGSLHTTGGLRRQGVSTAAKLTDMKKGSVLTSVLRQRFTATKCVGGDHR